MAPPLEPFHGTLISSTCGTSLVPLSKVELLPLKKRSKTAPPWLLIIKEKNGSTLQSGTVHFFFSVYKFNWHQKVMWKVSFYFMCNLCIRVACLWQTCHVVAWVGHIENGHCTGAAAHEKKMNEKKGRSTTTCEQGCDLCSSWPSSDSMNGRRSP